MFVRALLVASVVAGVAVAAQQSKPKPAAPPAQPSTLQRPTTGDRGKLVTETKHLTISASASAPSAVRGGKVSLFVDVAPKPKMHVYAPDQKDYIPISLTLKAGDGVRAGPIQFPEAETYFFAPLKETQRVYGKPFRIVQPVVLGKELKGESVTITGTVRYQACDDAICYVPQNIPVAWTIALK
jgi:DsbC/DsbD-like thiol-disulfide interchange protein